MPTEICDLRPSPLETLVVDCNIGCDIPECCTSCIPMDEGGTETPSTIMPTTGGTDTTTIPATTMPTMSSEPPVSTMSEPPVSTPVFTVSRITL